MIDFHHADSSHDSCGDSRPPLSSPAKLGRCMQLIVLAIATLTALAAAQNPVPQIVGPVKPMAIPPGSPAFTLSVFGANFVSGAVVNWNYQARATTFVSAHELQVQILATDVTKNTAGMISVTNPSGGGNSSASWAQVEVHVPTSSVAVNAFKAYPYGYWQVMPADFNHDTILDVVAEYGGDLGYYYGVGNGTFHFGSIAGRAQASPNQAVYGDFNGDGNLDVGVIQGVGQNTPTQMAVMLGDGKGKFTVGPRLKDFSGLSQVVVGDFNQDGKLDLAVHGKFQHLSMFLGNGDGTFQPAKNISNSMQFTEMLTGDFNGDGKLDLVLLAWGINQGVGIGVYLLLGNGDGTFQPLQTVATQSTDLPCGLQYSLQVSDFNGDGKLDIAYCTYYSGQIGILLGNGDGTFQAPVFYAGPDDIYSYAIGDINSDGKPDLLVSQYGSVKNQFVTYLGNGDGTFQSPQSMDSLWAEEGLTIGDFNSDGLLDFIYQTGGGMDVYIQQ